MGGTMPKNAYKGKGEFEHWERMNERMNEEMGK